MKKVIEILNKHDFEKTVCNAAKCANYVKDLGALKLSDNTLLHSAKSYIAHLINENELSDEDEAVIIEASLTVLATAVLKEMNITDEKVDAVEITEKHKMAATLAALTALFEG